MYVCVCVYIIYVLLYVYTYALIRVELRNLDAQLSLLAAR